MDSAQGKVVVKHLQDITYTLDSFRNHSSVWSINSCGYAFLSEEGSFHFRGADDISFDPSDVWKRIKSSVRVVLDWVIVPGGNCSNTATECKENSFCEDVEGGGHRCRCKAGYEGHPYLNTGCQDIDECENNNTCNGHVCNNTAGSFNCTCLPGYTYQVNGCLPIANDDKFPATVFTLALVIGLVTILVVLSGTFFGVRKRKLINLREKFFKQNGGVFLNQKLKAIGASEAVIIYSTEELQKATENYSKERIIGRGGYGVVYKGILSDKRVVAIKKSKLVDNIQAEQFINEIDPYTSHTS